MKISCRLVPNQSPKKIQRLVREFVKQRNPYVKIEIENSMWPYKAPTTGPLADAIKDAMKFSFGREPVFVREGGSIGAVISMEQVLETPVMFLGLSLPEFGKEGDFDRALYNTFLQNRHDSRTFDVSAVVQQGLAFTPIATHGDHYLGGDDLDDAMAEAIAGTVFRSSQFDMHRDACRWQELLFRCESAKRQLSSADEAPFHMRDAYITRGERRSLELLIDVPWARQVWASQMNRVRLIVGELLHRAGWTAEQVDVVGLIGGSSLVPAFRELLADGFGRDKLLMTPDAEIAVAQGATLLTARHRAQMSDQIPILVEAGA